MLQKPRETTAVKTRNNLFVLYLDGICINDSSGVTIEKLNGFMSKYRCLVLSRDIRKSNRNYPNALAVEQWQATLPSPAFQKHVIETYNTKIESIIYMSDDIYFITNALGSFSETIFINTKGIQMDYGKLPDLCFHSISGCLNAIDSSDCLTLWGEGIISNIRASSFRGLLGSASVNCDNHVVPVVFAGRYFGISHYRSAIDYYSIALRKNKDPKSKLFQKFDDVFRRIFTAEIKKICSLIPVDSICSIPDHETSKDGCGRFAEISRKLAEEFSLQDIQQFMHKMKNPIPQKSMQSFKDRQSNIKGSFIFDRHLEGKKVVIIDDILTTGATLKEASNALFAAGASDVICAVLGVNQFSIDYWIFDDELNAFQKK